MDKRAFIEGITNAYFTYLNKNPKVAQALYKEAELGWGDAAIGAGGMALGAGLGAYGMNEYNKMKNPQAGAEQQRLAAIEQYLADQAASQQQYGYYEANPNDMFGNYDAYYG